VAKSPAQLQLDIETYLADAKARETSSASASSSSSSSPYDPALQAKIDAFEAKQERKRDRLEAAASKARAESSARLGAARRLGDAIPFGQPILVGHHSERRHRRDIEKIDRNMRKGFAASDRANELASRAASIGTGGISSDDPIAVQKLKAELAPLVEMQAKMKAANAAIRKHANAGPAAQIAALVALGYSATIAAKLLEKDFAGRIGFADYKITNNGANIRRIEKRIAELAKKDETPARAPISGTIEGLTFTIRENKDANRTQIEFSGKPGEALRSKLKSAGFRWAPTEGAWQRQISNGAWYQATHALGVG
jgi:hypothetical protein